MQSAKRKMQNFGTALLFVGDDAHIVPFQSVSFTFCGRMWASAPTFIVYISVANNSTNSNSTNKNGGDLTPPYLILFISEHMPVSNKGIREVL